MKKQKSKGQEFLDLKAFEQSGIFITILVFMLWIVFRGIIAFFLVTFMTEYFGVAFGRYGLFLTIGAICWTIYPIMKHKVTLRLI